MLQPVKWSNGKTLAAGIFRFPNQKGVNPEMDYEADGGGVYRHVNTGVDGGRGWGVVWWAAMTQKKKETDREREEKCTRNIWLRWGRSYVSGFTEEDPENYAVFGVAAKLRNEVWGVGGSEDWCMCLDRVAHCGAGGGWLSVCQVTWNRPSHGPK